MCTHHLLSLLRLNVLEKDKIYLNIIASSTFYNFEICLNFLATVYLITLQNEVWMVTWQKFISDFTLLIMSYIYFKNVFLRVFCKPGLQVKFNV